MLRALLYGCLSMKRKKSEREKDRTEKTYVHSYSEDST